MEELATGLIIILSLAELACIGELADMVEERLKKKPEKASRNPIQDARDELWKSYISRG